MKIAIAGYGIEGESNYRYWASDPDNQITIVDQHQPERTTPHGIPLIIGEDAFKNLNGFDLVVRTAGLPPRNIITDGKMWSATNEFFEKCPALIIGVTGSKGKGTTASLITTMLQAAGKKVWLVGNIGLAALDVLAHVQPDDIVVYELSSFQLWDVERSPQVAVVLYIEQEHLDVHEDVTEYVVAKSNIARFQTESDIVIYNQENSYARSIADTSHATKTGYPDVQSAHIENGAFYYGEQLICSVESLSLLGGHNQDNACAAIDAVWSFTQNPSDIQKGLESFSGLPHRLEFVKTVGGVDYYDDSIATTPNATIAALRSFDQPKVIILGGSSKGSDFTELGKELASHEVYAIIIGQEAPIIVEACEQAGFIDYEVLTDTTMDEVVTLASQHAESGDVVLLSPASASFGMFKNYADRGDQFQRSVQAL